MSDDALNRLAARMAAAEQRQIDRLARTIYGSGTATDPYKLPARVDVDVVVACWPEPKFSNEYPPAKKDAP